MSNPQKVNTPGELDRADKVLAVELPLLVVEKVLRLESDEDSGIFGCLLQCQFGSGPLKPGKASMRIHLHTSSWSCGWVGSPGALTGATAADFAGLLCRGTVLHVVQGAVQVDKKQRRYVAVAEAALVRCAAEPWAVFKLLLDGWDYVAAATAANRSSTKRSSSEHRSLGFEDDAAAAAAATAVGAALGGCDRARLFSLRQLALEQHALGNGGSNQSSVPSDVGGDESSAGEGGRRVGRFRDVFRSDRKLRVALKALCDEMRAADGRRTGPRQRLRKTSKREWAALQRASARWPPLLGVSDAVDFRDTQGHERSVVNGSEIVPDVPTKAAEGAAVIDKTAPATHGDEVTLSSPCSASPPSLMTSEALRGNWGALEPVLNLPDPSNEARVAYLELKKKPQIRWMVAQLALLVAERRSQGLIHAETTSSSDSGSSDSGSDVVHLVDVGGGRGDLALVCCLALGAGVKITVLDNNAPSLEAGRQRAAALGLADSTISFVEGSVLSLLMNGTATDTPTNTTAAEKAAATNDVQETAAAATEEEESSQNSDDLKVAPSSRPASSSLSVKPADVVFGLHCCGGLSEAALSLAIAQRASFAICTCCFRSHPSLALLTTPKEQGSKAESPLKSKSATLSNHSDSLLSEVEPPCSQTSRDDSEANELAPAQSGKEIGTASHDFDLDDATRAALDAVNAAAEDAVKASEEALKGVRRVAGVMVRSGERVDLADAQSKITSILSAATTLRLGAALDSDNRNAAFVRGNKKPKPRSSDPPVALVEEILKKMYKAKSMQHLAAICGLQQDEIIALSSKHKGSASGASGIKGVDGNGTIEQSNGAQPSRKRSLESVSSSNVAIEAEMSSGSDNFLGKEPILAGVNLHDTAALMPLSVTAEEHADLRCVMTLAESEDSPQQSDAMAVVNRARLAVTKARFLAAHSSPQTTPIVATAAAAQDSASANKSCPESAVRLDAKQGVFPEDYSHRNRVLIGSVRRGVQEVAGT